VLGERELGVRPYLVAERDEVGRLALDAGDRVSLCSRLRGGD
jgi:hypothetical protein